MSDRIPLSEAAKRMGKAQSTLRRLATDGRIRTTKDAMGRHLVSFEDVLAHYALKTDASMVRSERAESPLADALRAQCASLERSLERERAEKDRLASQLERLQSELLKLTAEMRAILTKETGNKPSNWFRR